MNVSLKETAFILGERLVPHVLERRIAESAIPDFLRVGVVFIHIPRTAGLSVARTLYGENAWPRHFTLDQLLRLSVTDTVISLPRFTILRNPWDRAVSSFHFAIHGGGTDGSTKLNTFRHCSKRKFRSFDAFVHEFLPSTDLWKADPVFKPQSYYVSIREFTHLGDFDRLDQTELWLSHTLGRKITFPRINASPRGPIYRTYYTPETRDIVATVYRDDVDRFGFDF